MKILKPNVATRVRYRKQLNELIGLMYRDYNRNIKKLLLAEFKDFAMDSSLSNQASFLLNKLSKKWLNRFSTFGNAFINSLVNQIDRNATKSLNKALGVSIDTTEMTKDLKEKLQAHIKENVNLIKSVPFEFHKKIENSISRSIQQGLGTKNIYDTALSNMREGKFNQEKRAKLIATLENNKITSTIESEKMQKVGVTKFVWRHSGGGAEPRKLHKKYDGQIFELNNPPVIDEKLGIRGLPGTIWNCGCFMEPYLEFLED